MPIVDRTDRLNILVLAFSIFALLSVTPAQAIPVTYDESVDGDLPFILTFPLPAASVFAFDVGTNTFTGSSIWPDAFTQPDWDFIPFSLPSGTALTSVALQVAQTAGEGLLTDVTPRLTALTASFDFDGDLIDEPLTVPFTASIFGSVLPLEGGNYLACICGLTGFLGEGSIVYAYQWQFEVSEVRASVPEPSSLLLVGSGLLGMAAYRRIRPR